MGFSRLFHLTVAHATRSAVFHPAHNSGKSNSVAVCTLYGTNGMDVTYRTIKCWVSFVVRLRYDCSASMALSMAGMAVCSCVMLPLVVYSYIDVCQGPAHEVSSLVRNAGLLQ